MNVFSATRVGRLSPLVRSVRCSGFGPNMGSPGRNNEGKELSWDPEKLFGPPESGLIARRELKKRMETDKEFATKVADAQNQMEREAMARRVARKEPEDLEGFIEYFLNTDMADMQYEVTRYRPKLTGEFFTLLDRKIGNERFVPDPDQDKLSELESLRTYLEEAVKAIDKTVGESTSAAERFKKLLMAKDKKATILEMVSANEIDQLLVDLINQNIEAAKKAEETQKAEFMEKLRDACKRYV